MNKIFLIAIGLLLSGNIFAQYENTLLWEISGNELEESSYLYGTMHLQDDRVYRFGDSVMVKFESCDAIALEIADDIFGDPAAMDMSILGDIMMNGVTLEELISPEDFKEVKKLFAESLKEQMPDDAGMGSQLMGTFFSGFLVNKLKPLFTSTLISTKGANKDHELPLDAYLNQEGKKLGKKIIGIETIGEQMEAINKVPVEDQAEMLVEMIQDLDAAGEEMEKMIEVYEKQDMNALNEMMSGTGMEEGEAFEDEILIKRNFVMLERIDSIIKMQTTFIAVGAGHLVGETGLIDQLRKKGYTVNPVMSEYTGTSLESIVAAKDFELMKSYMSGTFDSEMQAEEDTSYYNISLEMHPVWEDQEGTWLYVEQALSSKKDKPYRQRLYKLEMPNDSTFVSYIYTLPEPEKFVGKWDDDELFSDLTPEMIEIREGCEVVMKKRGDGFAGQTGEKTCGSTLRGATYATSKVTLTKVGIISWDQGFDENDEQVWGAEKGGYIFQKK